MYGQSHRLGKLLTSLRLIAIGAVIGSGCAIQPASVGSTRDGADEVAAIEQLYADYRVAVETGSIPGYLAVLHPQVRLLPPGAEAIEGAQRYASFLEPVFAGATYRIEVVSLPQIQVMGDVAVAEYDYIIHLTLKDAQQGIEQAGALTQQRTRSRYFDVLRKQTDGRWAIWRHTWNVIEVGDAAPPLRADDDPPIDDIELSFIETNGVTLRVAQAGSGPVVLLAHGFPESWFSWRHQLRALAAAGYRAVAPDMRGYGMSSAPADPAEYTLNKLAADMVGVLDALGVSQAHMVGHDWGSPVASHTVVQYPQRFSSLTLMSVPYGPRAPAPPLQAMLDRVGDNFYYMAYHNEPNGVAEAEYDANVRTLLRRIYQSPNAARAAPQVTDPRRSAGGWLPRLGEPMQLPDWLSEVELDYYVTQFERSGFRGGVNYYRTFDQNWVASAAIEDPVIRVPVLFLAGAQDGVIGGATAAQLRARMAPVVEHLQDVVLIPDVGHWVQQEAATQTNTTLLTFLDGVQGR